MDTDTEQLSITANGLLQKNTPSFEELSTSILQTHQSAQAGAIRAINKMATLRNWLVLIAKGKSLTPLSPIKCRVNLLVAHLLKLKSATPVYKHCGYDYFVLRTFSAKKPL